MPECIDAPTSVRGALRPLRLKDGTTTVVGAHPPGIDPTVQPFPPSWMNIGADVPCERSSSGRRPVPVPDQQHGDN
jgi:hypothetical protein